MKKRTKFLLLRTSILVAFAILSTRLWYVQVVMGSYYKQQADISKIRLEPVPALRGILYDRTGVPLVFNAPSWQIQIVPHGIPQTHPERIYQRLAAILGGHPSAARMQKLVNSFQWEAYLPVVIKDNVSTETAMEIRQMHLELPGVRAEPSSIRRYNLDPEDSLSHILGYPSRIDGQTYSLLRRLYPRLHYTANDYAGSAGVEASMEPYLHGVNDNAQVMVDSGERPIRVLQKARSVPGDDVYLTINDHFQKQVASDLQIGLQHVGVKRGVAVVEDVHTGQILAMVSLPSYNNDLFSPYINQTAYNRLLHDPAHPLLDLATQGQFAPGSTYKIITAAAALETGVANAATTIDDTGLIKLCSQFVTNSCQYYYGWTPPPGLGPETITGALAQSSDIYFYTVSGGNPNSSVPIPYIGADRLAHYAHLMGLGSPTGIEIPGEAAGFVPSKTWFDRYKPDGIVKNPGETWHIGNTYNMAIGQGQNIATPLQIVNVSATIANGGTLYRPRVIQRIVGRITPGRGISARRHVVQPFVPSIIRKNFLSPSTISLIQEGLHDGVAWTNWKGTSWLVHDARIDAAGKTGTAEATGGPNAWWVGYAPFSAPKIAVCVMVPNADAEGSYAAAPIAHKILEDYFHLKPIAEPGEPLWPNDVRQQLVGSTSGNQ